MSDKIEIIGKGTCIQHGKQNNRVYLMKLDERDIDIILPQLSRIADENNYSKIFCKIPGHITPLFFADGYILEALIPKFYNSKTDAFFVSKFIDSKRLLNIDREQLTAFSELLAQKLTEQTKTKKISSQYTIRKLKDSDVEQIAELYKIVFKTYPFPIQNPDYILETMNENIQYFGIEKAGKLVALSSSEIDFKGENAEMTDFATHPEHKGNNLSSILLKAMEEEMKIQKISTLYTIARLNSIAMNKTFLRNGYRYSGTLRNNTDIAGRIESMNVYYKHV